MKINRNSWHYRLMLRERKSEFMMPDDLCGYWSYLMLLLAMYAVACVFYISITIFVLGILYIVGFIMYFSVVEYATEFIFYFVLPVVAFLLVIFGIKVTPTVVLDRGVSTSGLVKERYRSWKENYCAKVEYVGDEND